MILFINMMIQMPGFLGFDTVFLVVHFWHAHEVPCGDLLMCSSTRAANSTVEKDKEQRHSKCAQANRDDFRLTQLRSHVFVIFQYLTAHANSISYPKV